MLYLGRPVFEFPINWAEPVNKSFSYNLDDLKLGFGAEVFTGLQTFTVQGHDITLDLPSETEIKAFDDFTAALLGRLTGFWLPVPMEAAALIGANSATQLQIQYAAVADSLANDPATHIYLVRNGYVSFVAKVNNAAVVGLNETLDLDTAIPDWATLMASKPSLYRLQYVRFADDTESAKFQTEGWQRRSLRLVELPHEYAVAETGQKPIWLYHFWVAAPMDVHWYYTSFAAAVVSQNKLHAAASITHGTLKTTAKPQTESVDISAPYDANHPFALFVPVPFARPLNVEISETSYGTPDVVTKRFVGRVLRVPDSGEKLSAECVSFAAILSRNVPGTVIKKDCNYQVYEPRTCKVLKQIYETTATLFVAASVAYPPTIEVTLMFPTVDRKSADWFAHGWLEVGQGMNFEIRTILSSSYSAVTDRVTLKLNAALLHAVNGQAMQLIPGCSGDYTTACGPKFNNQLNFGGFIAVPEKNLSIASFEHSAAAGDKK